MSLLPRSAEFRYSLWLPIMVCRAFLRTCQEFTPREEEVEKPKSLSVSLGQIHFLAQLGNDTLINQRKLFPDPPIYFGPQCFISNISDGLIHKHTGARAAFYLFKTPCPTNKIVVWIRRRADALP